MTTATKASFTGSIPENYDQLLGPAWFDAFASDLAARVPAKPPGAVLEIACGTGLVTGHLRRRLDPSTRLVATDLSKAMLDYAAQRLASAGVIDFREADAMQLPFPDGSFGVVVCGFGIMFVPDKARAMAEMRRVLAPGGLLFFNVWDRIEANPTSLAAAEVIEGLFPGDDEVRFRVPYEMGDAGDAAHLVANAASKSRAGHAAGSRSQGSARHRDRPGPRDAASLCSRRRALPSTTSIERHRRALSESSAAIPYRSTAQAIVVEARAA
jgi:ubiquinone/menaquinone biosynthesis C-methylase UbiE